MCGPDVVCIFVVGARGCCGTNGASAHAEAGEAARCSIVERVDLAAIGDSSNPPAAARSRPERSTVAGVEDADTSAAPLSTLERTAVAACAGNPSPPAPAAPRFTGERIKLVDGVPLAPASARPRSIAE